jgi:hypothetical protein
MEWHEVPVRLNSLPPLGNHEGLSQYSINFNIPAITPATKASFLNTIELLL